MQKAIVRTAVASAGGPAEALGEAAEVVHTLRTHLVHRPEVPLVRRVAHQDLPHQRGEVAATPPANTSYNTPENMRSHQREGRVIIRLQKAAFSAPWKEQSYHKVLSSYVNMCICGAFDCSGFPLLLEQDKGYNSAHAKQGFANLS